eukprot:5961483-Pleurochrysis_carterae.AAC.3
MEGSTRGAEVCRLLTPFISCVVRGPWSRKLLCAQASQRNAEVNDGGESRTRGAGEQQECESSAARGLHWCRRVSCVKAACEAVEPRDVDHIGHPPPAQIQWLCLGCRRRWPSTISLCKAATLASLPPASFAGGLPPEAIAVRAQRRHADERLEHACAG